MTRTGGATSLLGAIVGIAALCVGWSSPAAAQALQGSADTAPVKRDQAAKKPAKTGNVRRAGAERSARDSGRDNWTINDALPKDSKARVIETPAPAKVDLGRLPFETGTVGIETERRVKEGQFSDGRPVPGLETVKRDQPSFFGLSLSVPTTDKSLIPLPAAPRE